jgi:hypothetical protein
VPSDRERDGQLILPTFSVIMQGSTIFVNIGAFLAESALFPNNQFNQSHHEFQDRHTVYCFRSDSVFLALASPGLLVEGD